MKYSSMSKITQRGIEAVGRSIEDIALLPGTISGRVSRDNNFDGVADEIGRASCRERVLMPV